MSWLGLHSRIPITVKVPVVVVLLMVAVGVVAWERVLSRLISSQERQLGDLANAYLDGLASPLVQPVLREDSWEIFDVLDRAHRLYAAVRPVETIVTDATGLVLAASNPRHAPIGSRLPPDFPVSPDRSSKVQLQESAARAFIDRKLVVEGRTIGTVHGELDILPLLAERREVLWTLIASNALLTLLFAALGWFAVRRMVAPMKVLTEHLEFAADGTVEPIPESRIPAVANETHRLFRSFNRMARALSEREALLTRFADEERLASLGRLASGVAHEINNPLGGLFNALDTLKVHGDKPQVRQGAIALLQRGLRNIHDVVRSALATYRPDREARNLLAADLEDLRLLTRGEAQRKLIEIDWSVSLPTEMGVPAFPVRQIALNLLLNACRAAPERGWVAFSARIEHGCLIVEIGDLGPGMDAEILRFLAEPGTSAPITGGAGLGLWVARRMALELEGNLGGERSHLGGALVRLTLPCRPMEGALPNVA